MKDKYGKQAGEPVTPLEEELEDETGLWDDSNRRAVEVDPRATSCCPTDIDAMNRRLNEQYFGGNYSR